MEIDHLFICVKPGAREAELLREFGLAEGVPNTHPGQGTANRRFFFHNAYLELLFLDDGVETDVDVVQSITLRERLINDGAHACPFGVAFRPGSEAERNAPFPSWAYRPPYLPADWQIEMAKDAPLSEPEWLFATFFSSPERMPVERQQPLQHHFPLHNIKSVALTLPSIAQLSVAAKCVAQLPFFEIIGGDTFLLEIGFDDVKKGQQHDFRPTLPLLFKW